MPWRPDGEFLAIFCVLYFQRAACSRFQTCILNSHQSHPVVWPQYTNVADRQTDILVENRILPTQRASGSHRFQLGHPCWGQGLCQNFIQIFVSQNTSVQGYHWALTVWRWLQPCWCNTRTWQTDRHILVAYLLRYADALNILHAVKQRLHSKFAIHISVYGVFQPHLKQTACSLRDRL